MKSKKVETVTSDEENLRLRIYDGEIPLDNAGAELLRLLRWEVARGHEFRLRMLEERSRAPSRAERKASFADRAALARQLKPRKIR